MSTTPPKPTGSSLKSVRPCINRLALVKATSTSHDELDPVAQKASGGAISIHFVDGNRATVSFTKTAAEAKRLRGFYTLDVPKGGAVMIGTNVVAWEEPPSDQQRKALRSCL